MWQLQALGNPQHRGQRICRSKPPAGAVPRHVPTMTIPPLLASCSRASVSSGISSPPSLKLPAAGRAQDQHVSLLVAALRQAGRQAGRLLRAQQAAVLRWESSGHSQVPASATTSLTTVHQHFDSHPNLPPRPLVHPAGPGQVQNLATSSSGAWRTTGRRRTAGACAGTKQKLKTEQSS